MFQIDYIAPVIPDVRFLSVTCSPVFLKSQALGLQHAYPAFDQVVVSGGNETTGVYTPSPYPSGSSATTPNLSVNMQFPYVAATPTLLGKG